MAEGDGVSLKEFIEAILDEQRRGMIVAEEEREKSAVALRDELTRQITAGDQALRDHIMGQVEQIRMLAEALDEQSKLRIDGLAALLRQQFAASEKAIEKSDASTEKRFEGVNEWRAQSADRERSQAEQLALFTSEFIRADVHKAEIAQLQRQISELQDRVSKIA